MAKERKCVAVRTSDPSLVCSDCQALKESDPKRYHRIGSYCPECGAVCGCDWHEEGPDDVGD